MARQVIDLGTSPNRGDGDPLRTAFDKINDNFAELYAGNFTQPDQTASDLVPSADATYNLGNANRQWADLHVADFIYLNGARIEVTSSGSLLINGGAPAEIQDVQGSVFADDSTLLVDGVNGVIPASVLDGTLDRNNIPVEYLRFPDPEILVTVPTPTSTGTKGEVRYAAGYVYICVDTDTWVRSAVETAWG